MSSEQLPLTEADVRKSHIRNLSLFSYCLICPCIVVIAVAVWSIKKNVCCKEQEECYKTVKCKILA